MKFINYLLQVKKLYNYYLISKEKKKFPHKYSLIILANIKIIFSFQLRFLLFIAVHNLLFWNSLFL